MDHGTADSMDHRVSTRSRCTDPKSDPKSVSPSHLRLRLHLRKPHWKKEAVDIEQQRVKVEEPFGSRVTAYRPRGSELQQHVREMRFEIEALAAKILDHHAYN